MQPAPIPISGDQGRQVLEARKAKPVTTASVTAATVGAGKHRYTHRHFLHVVKNDLKDRDCNQHQHSARNHRS